MILNILKTSYYSEAMSVATWIICNLLLKAQNMPVFFVDILAVSEILKNLSGCFSQTEYLQKAYFSDQFQPVIHVCVWFFGVAQK